MRWFGRRRAAASAARWAEVPPRAPIGRAGGSDRLPRGTGDPEPPVDRLSVDGTVVPVRSRVEEFEPDVRAGRLALLRTAFPVFGTQADPLFALAEAGAGNVTDLCTLCCLRCSARHSVNAIYTRSLLGRDPITACQRCGCPDGVLLHDPTAETRPDGPYDLRRVSGAGTRVERVWIWSRSADLGPDAVRTVLDLVDQGEDVTGARVTTMAIPPGHEDVEGLAAAVAVREDLAPDRLVWVRYPPYGDVLVALVTSG